MSSGKSELPAVANTLRNGTNIQTAVRGWRTKSLPRGGLLRKIQAAQEVPDAQIGPQVKQARCVALLVPVNSLIFVEVGHCSLTSLQQRLVKTGGRLVKHARYYWLVLAGGASHAAAFWQYAETDCGVAPAGGLVIRERGKSSAEKSSRGTCVSGKAGGRRDTGQTSP